MAKWKPSVGDKFICSVSHHTDCGDYKCDGLDTVMFEIIDTANNAVSEPSAVAAATTAIGVHLTSYAWGFGWDSSSVSAHYKNTTYMASQGQRSIETSFLGYDSGWTAISVPKDTSVIFQGRSYAAVASNSSDFFVPALGWFFSLRGYERPCLSDCIVQYWTMSLISASKTKSSVQADPQSNAYLLSGGSLLQLVNVEASNITLSDLLGRPIHSWQLPIEAGPRQITLNVADVPSGIYFLKLTAPEVEEVRKVVITH